MLDKTSGKYFSRHLFVDNFFWITIFDKIYSTPNYYAHPRSGLARPRKKLRNKKILLDFSGITPGPGFGQLVITID